MEVYGFIWPLFLNLLAHLFHIHLTLFSSGCQDNSKQYAFTSVFGFIKFAHIQCTSSTFFFFCHGYGEWRTKLMHRHYPEIFNRESRLSSSAL